MQIFSPSRPQAALLLTGLLLGSSLLHASSAMAKTRYIKLNNEVSVRRGKGMEFKPITAITDGTAVELITEEQDWALVRLSDQTEGWLRKRYLSPTPRSSQSENEAEEAARNKDAQLAALSQENSVTRKDLDACSAERIELGNKYQTLKSESADVLATQATLQEANNELETMRRQLAVLQIENGVLRKNEQVKWFLAGSGVLLAGWVIGRFATLGRKRKSSLL